MQFKTFVPAMIAATLLVAGCSKAPAITAAQSTSASAAEAKSILAHTVSVDWLVNNLMGDHDFNQNGLIDLTKSKNPFGQEAGTASVTWEYKKKLFVEADADKDGKVTRDELDKKIRSYDADGDGKMHSRGLLGAAKKQPLGELDKLDKDYHLSSLLAIFGPLFNW